MANPTLSKFDKIDFGADLTQGNTMTVHGTAAKTGVLLALAFVTAALAWRWISLTPSLLAPLAWGGIIMAFIFAYIGTSSPKTTPYIAPLYAIFKGFALGAVSLIVSKYVGERAGDQYIVVKAVLLTFGVMAGVLALYGFRIIKVTGKLVGGIIAGVIAVALFGFVMILFRMGTGSTALSFMDGSPLSIGISVLIIIVAAALLLVNFDLIEKGAEQGAPKYMEWYGALGLMITLVWLYLEILSLLSKLNSRN